MAFRQDILAGKAVILLSIKDNLDKELRSARAKLFNFGNNLSRIGQDLSLFGALGAAGGLFPVREFMTFQDRLLMVQTKLQATDRETVGLEKTIRNLGRTTSFTSQQVAEAAQQLAQAGFSIPQIENSLQAVLDLGRAGEIGLQEAAQTLILVMKSFDKSADEANAIASKLITAARLGPLDLSQMSEALKFVVQRADGLNISFEKTIGLITVLSNKGLRGTLAGTSLNKALEGAGANRDMLKDIFDIDVDDGSFTDLFAFLDELSVKAAKLSRVERMEAFGKIFSIRGERGIGPILDQLEQLEDIVGQIDASSDEARKAALKLDAALGGTFRRGLSAFQEAMISIGSTTEGPLISFGEVVRKVLANVSQLAEENPKLIQTILLIPPVALAAGLGLMFIGGAITKLGLLITPVIGVANLLLATLAKFASTNLNILGKGLSLTTSPFTTLSQKIAAEDAAVAKAQARLARALGGADETKVLRQVGRLDRAKDALTAAKAGGDKAIIKTARAQVKSAEDLLKKTLAGKNLGNVRQAFAAAEKAIGAKGFLTKTREVKNIGSVFKNLWKTLKGFSFTRLLSGISKSFKMFNFGSIIPKIMKFVTSFNYFRGIINIVKTLGGVLKTFFTILNGVRRFVFSFGGILTIIEFLIIAGPRIAPIKAILDGLGAGFRGLFDVLGQMGKGLGPELFSFFDGLKKAATGNLNAGLEQVKESLVSIKEIISTGLAFAWQSFVKEAEKGIIFLKGSLGLLLGAFEGISAVLGSAAAVGFGSRGTDPKPYEFGEGPIDFLKGVAFTMTAAIEGIGMVILDIVSFLRTTIITIKDIIISIYRMIADSWFGSAEDREKAATLQGPEALLDYLVKNNTGTDEEETRIVKLAHKIGTTYSLAVVIGELKKMQSAGRLSPESTEQIAKYEARLKELLAVDPNTLSDKGQLDYYKALAYSTPLHGLRINEDGTVTDYYKLQAEANRKIKELEAKMRGEVTDEEFLEKEKIKLKNSMQAIRDSIIEGLEPLEKNLEEAREAFEKALYAAAFRRIARRVENLPDLIQDKAIEAFERVKAEATKIVGGAQTEKDEEGKPIPGQSTPLGFLTALYDLGVGAMREEKQKQIEAEAAPGLQAALFGLKAIVGTFNEVYGQKIQMVPSDADKIREKQLDLANERLKDIANQQPVFQ